MGEERFQEKTEQATAKKREKSREEGQVSRSPEIASVAVLLTGVLILYAFTYFFYGQLLDVLRQDFIFTAVPDLTQAKCIRMLLVFSRWFLILVLPVMAGVMVAAVAANLFQVGFVISGKPLAFKWDRFDVFKGMGRLLSLRSFEELVKSGIKLGVIGIVAFLVVRSELEQTIRVYDTDTAGILVFILTVIFKIFIWVLIVMVAVAILDYAYQRWQYEKDLRMTKQEVKEENKQSEGDPHVKSRIRSIQYRAARKRMMQAVPEADVVVTNPTRLAIALRYDASRMSAPQVVAKGAGRIAQRIGEIAREHRVPLVENRELARNLYPPVDIGDEVPSEFLVAVAETLAYVYRLKGKRL